MKELNTPDVTPIQGFVAAVSAVLAAGMALINAFEWYDISGPQAATVLGLWAAIGGLLVSSDAVIRHGRSRALTLPPKGIVADEDAKKKTYRRAASTSTRRR